MMIFWNAGIVLLSVPKTGTQANIAAWGGMADIVIRHPPTLKHMPAGRFRRKFAPLLPNGGKGLSLVAVVREPLDWLGSWYRYRSRPALAGHPNSTAGIGFDEFVAAWLKDDPPEFAQVGSQARFLSDGDGHVLTDKVFHYDDPAALRDFLGSELGSRLPVPGRQNVSPPLALQLGAATRQRAIAALAPDYAICDAARAA